MCVFGAHAKQISSLLVEANKDGSHLDLLLLVARRLRLSLRLAHEPSQRFLLFKDATKDVLHLWEKGGSIHVQR